ncbi:hypothetical protein OsJ_13767 [Oryza sativa Japonica Group]|uniref:Uncharacterized protein n=1 Tax=Oryza sativa subsp. japonica TaxID=39947 RepID=B9FDL7_ORYSJ|nr:hypothetical protein OsJ_13767 [Oryza sativa Japonica Group]
MAPHAASRMLLSLARDGAGRRWLRIRGGDSRPISVHRFVTDCDYSGCEISGDEDSGRGLLLHWSSFIGELSKKLAEKNKWQTRPNHKMYEDQWVVAN